MANCKENVIFLEKVPENILKELHEELSLWDYKNDRFFLNRVFEMHKARSFRVSRYSPPNSVKSEKINGILKWLSKFYPGKKPFWVFFIALYPGQRLPVHKDTLKFHEYTNRIHIPLVTEPTVSMVFFEKNQTEWQVKKHHLGINSAWEVNNIIPHSAENLSQNWRVHLLIDLIDEQVLNNQSDLLSTSVPQIESFDLDFEFQKDPNLEIWTYRKIGETFDAFNKSTV